MKLLKEKTLDELMNELVYLGGDKRIEEINSRIFEKRWESLCKRIESIQAEIKRRCETEI